MGLPQLSRSILRRNTSIPPLTFLSLHRHGHLLLFFTTTSANASSRKPHFMEEYLVSTCRFSPDAAAKAMKRLSHLTSPAKPDAVLAFLRSQGLDVAQIGRLLSWSPWLLCSNVDATLSPKFRAVRALGFDRSEVARLFADYPTALSFGLRSNLLPRIMFWLDLLGSTKSLMKCLKRRWLLKYSLDPLLQNLSLLRSYGIPDSRVATVLTVQPTLITQKPAVFKALVDRVEACGIPRSSGMFVWGLFTLHNVSESAFHAKKRAMMSIGCSEQEFLAMFCRAPCFLSMSDETMQRKVEFLKGKAGCSIAYLVKNPVLLTLSLEKRMIPRCRAIEILKSKGVDIGKLHSGGIMRLSEIQFMERYILKHKEEVPELLETYTSECRHGT